jgi:hypothetical protein
MKSIIYELDEQGNITEKAIYTVTPKQALINYIMQFKKKNHNFWMYPETLEGIRESKTVKDHWYFDYNNIVIASYPA